MAHHDHDLIQELRQFTEAFTNGTVTRRDAAELAHSLTGVWCEFEGSIQPTPVGMAPGQQSDPQSQQREASPELQEALQTTLHAVQQGGATVPGGTRDQQSSQTTSAKQPAWVAAQKAQKAQQSKLPNSQWNAPNAGGGGGGENLKAPSMEMAPPQPAGGFNVQTIIQIIMFILQNLDRFQR